jgi:hypothetical protein
MRSALVSAALMFAVTGVVSAQESGVRGPTLQGGLLSATVQAEALPRLLPSAARPVAAAPAIIAPMAPSGQSVALMIAGGALFVAGAIAGDDVGGLLMLGGAVIGAYGVYLHFVR